MPDQENDAQVRLRKTGELYIIEEGKQVVIARYDRKSGFLEFETKEYSSKYYNQCCARIGTVNKGTEESGFIIRSFGVKGTLPTDVAKAPKRPKLGPLGDSAEEVVGWFLKYDLPQAIIRYGIYCDPEGNPIRRNVRRIFETTQDNREIEQENLEWKKTGGKSQERNPISVQREYADLKDQIIARRATALTFIPAEVIGGFQPDEDLEASNVQSQEGD